MLFFPSSTFEESQEQQVYGNRLVPQPDPLPPDLVYVKGYISSQEHNDLLSIIDQSSWCTDLKRRVQHYGYRYDYSARSVDSSMSLGELPDWGKGLAHRLFTKGYMPKIADQLIVNEYQSGQGISAHVDCVSCFGPVIVSISLGSLCLMEFNHLKTKNSISILIDPCSLLVLSGDARYKWRHQIRARKSDLYKGKKYVRGRRISLTFRTVIMPD